jgi:hypothetical protein
MEYGTQGPPTPPYRTGRPTRETETKQAFKTTEFWIYIVILLGLFIAGLVSDGGSDDAIDGFGAERVWLYAVILSAAYMISRGIAKSGSRDPYTPEANVSGGESIGDRVKAAAEALKGEGGDATATHPTQQAPGTTQY